MILASRESVREDDAIERNRWDTLYFIKVNHLLVYPLFLMNHVFEILSGVQHTKELDITNDIANYGTFNNLWLINTRLESIAGMITMKHCEQPTV